MNEQAIGTAEKLDAPARLRAKTPEPRFRVTHYAALLKPRVMSLVVFTAAVGLVLAPGFSVGAPGAPGTISP